MKRVIISFFLLLATVFLVINNIFFPAAEYLAGRYLKDEFKEYSRNSVKGIFYLIENDLKNIPLERWQDYITSLNRHFDFPIHLIDENEIHFTKIEQQQFDEGLIVLGEKGSHFYDKIDNSSFILDFGPMGGFKSRHRWIEIFLYGAVLLILGIISVLWAFPFWKKLRHICESATAFGNGNLDIRVKVPKHSLLAPLAESFNRMADQIQMLMNAQKELGNAVSHELRTPISRIRFSMEMLENAVSQKEIKNYLVEIQYDIDELDNLVAESLTYSSFDRCSPVLKIESVEIDPWLREIVNKAMHGYSNIDFMYKPAWPALMARPQQANEKSTAAIRPSAARFSDKCKLSDKHVTAAFDTRFMARAIGNLIRNATIHTSSRIHVTLLREEKDCVIHVDDDGPGIPEVDRERIFQPFIRLDTSRNRDSGGFGLGLAIVERVIKWHTGKIIVSDSPLGGARFTIRWPGFENN